MRHWQSEFWAAFSRELVVAADVAMTVSPPLAEVMAEKYGRKFHTVPNCASLAEADALDIERKLSGRSHREEIIFLFQGAFAPGRGLEQLISSWQFVDPRARLLLRGLESEFKETAIEVARSLGLLDRSVFFPRGVSEDRLVAAAGEADVGLIPYEPISINNRLSCPNKLSQYLAAGLPVICNQLDFVRAVVVDNGIGSAVDFRDPKAVAAVVNDLVSAPDRLQAMARQARKYFETQFHWEYVFDPVRREILDIEFASSTTASTDGLDFSWVANENVMRGTKTEVAATNANAIAVAEGGQIVEQIVEPVDNSPMAEAVQRSAGLISRIGTLIRGPDRAARIAASLRYRAHRYLSQSKDYAAHR
jgi:glycosyltransferase involved in cell wall biosynthesis